MATITNAPLRPVATADPRAPSRPRLVGLSIAGVGLALATIAFVGSLVAAGDEAARATTLPWTFGLTTLGFGTVKLGIGIILWGILMKLWLRIDAIGVALPDLVARSDSAPLATGDVDTHHGTVSVTDRAPGELAIHRMATTMWRPMLAMGFMAVSVGFVVSLAWSSGGGLASAAWTQGLQFLGEGMLLGGIAFLLGTILWAIRTGGGEVQEGLGVAVKTLRMPATAKLFVGLMMLGLMISIAQFVGYLVVAGGGVDAAAWSAFLGPFRELGLALILAGITMALVTIATALAFQFDRVVELIDDGR